MCAHFLSSLTLFFCSSVWFIALWLNIFGIFNGKNRIKIRTLLWICTACVRLAWIYSCISQCIRFSKAATNNGIMKKAPRKEEKSRLWLENVIKSTIVLLQKKFIWIFSHFNAILSYWWAFANKRSVCVQANNKNMLIGDMRKTWMVFQKFWQHYCATAKQWQQWQQSERVRMNLEMEKKLNSPSTMLNNNNSNNCWYNAVVLAVEWISFFAAKFGRRQCQIVKGQRASATKMLTQFRP